MGGIAFGNQYGRAVKTYNDGIKCFSKEGKLIANYNTQNSSLSSDIVLCMTDFNGKIWMGTDGGGINILNPENGNITASTEFPTEQLDSYLSKLVRAGARVAISDMEEQETHRQTPEYL